jgi:MHS family proline/betaine transporter-like MFS transporter
MSNKIQTFTDLRLRFKKVVILLSFGTLFEYFDLMLYVHMGTILNELFFGTSDAESTRLLNALGLFLTFGARPLGAYAFGKIGDNYGRVIVMYITTIMMAFACGIMAILPTYAQIGLTAGIIMSLCRIIQSLSSVGEVTSCDLYLIETSKPPIQYPLAGVADVFGILGGTLALGVVSLVTITNFDWRMAFWAGAGIAFIGFYARKALAETSDFADVQMKIKLIMDRFKVSYKEAKKIMYKNTEEKQYKKGVKKALLVIQCVYPLYFHLSYIYCGDLLTKLFGYSAVDVIHNNFFLSIVDFINVVLIYFISYYINPLKILKVQWFLSSILLISLPFLLNNVSEPHHLIIIQYLLVILAIHGMPAFPIFYKYIPVSSRFKTVGMQYAWGRVIMFSFTSFCLIYLEKWFGYIGFLPVFIFVLICYTIALFYFDRLEKESTKS